MFITASKLYDFMQCPHKVWRDVYGPQEEKIDEKNPFVELLWEKGVLHEKDIISKVGSFVDLSEGTIEERIGKTLEEIQNGAPLIYQGVIHYENLLGVPDLLRRMPTGDYLPIDIKSGKGFEGQDEFEEEEIMPKKHYAVQLSLYVEILLKLSFAREKKGAIIDISGRELVYLLESVQGVRNAQTWWELYLEIKNRVLDLLSNKTQDKPAIAGTCKLCPWYISCKKWCLEKEDLTKIFHLGRSGREVLNKDLGIEKVRELKVLNVPDLLVKKKKDKTFLKGFGETLLKKFIDRAIILEGGKPILHQQINLPKVKNELFFDIEDDPTQDFVYLHGVYCRDQKGERFIYFLARENSRDSEKRAWKEFWNYINSLPVGDFAVYYYSHHEKSAYKRLSQRYPDVIKNEEREAFFANPNAIDLFQIIQKYTDWPLSSYSLKDLAIYLGFKWRDESPSGALSIRWYNDFLQNHSEDILKRILEYNEDDCRATMVLKDGISKLSQG
ncbi:MAG: TM0106 family RecB-like putative nuclease [Candidatus Omnitrophica bacterium]|nr:TM0106 family RecB-like putative nuclease [Candidatus Omnitrophota bacterium]